MYFITNKLITTALSALIKLAANKLPCLAPIALLKLLKKILLIAIRICYCVTLCYLVYKHSCLLAYCLLIYIRIVSRDRLLSFNSIKGNIINSNAKI
ncbi:hypothetical protein HBI82_116190 [Parastagonospora nodorum]|nr:hypothetical protein HBI45_118720 [Parastagonospora nodorum]KAH6015044.1 hypothetical protein HBI82_116190 [Parastagonospora nodorum]KAH6028025.1 hypothetical protein HBI83_046900 [Parastagonospora nodorum]